MNDLNYRNIMFSIRHMRKSQVEPEMVLMNERVYQSLGSPRNISRVPVEVDNNTPCEWMVR